MLDIIYPRNNPGANFTLSFFEKIGKRISARVIDHQNNHLYPMKYTHKKTHWSMFNGYFKIQVSGLKKNYLNVIWPEPCQFSS